MIKYAKFKFDIRLSFFSAFSICLRNTSFLLNIVWETLVKVLVLTSISLRRELLLLLQLLRNCIDLWLRHFACDIPLWEDGTTSCWNEVIMGWDCKEAQRNVTNLFI
jgi:hypothetical protein